MATIVKGYSIYTRDYGLLDEGQLHDKVLLMIVPDDKNTAIDEIDYFSQNHCWFDLMKYNRNVLEDGTGICWTSVDPKMDGYYYKIWYEPCEFVFV